MRGARRWHSRGDACSRETPCGQAIKERGYERGDRLLYRVRADSVRIVVSEKGKIYVDTTDVGKDAPRIVMASYFAPRSDFREPLLRSLFD